MAGVGQNVESPHLFCRRCRKVTKHLTPLTPGVMLLGNIPHGSCDECGALNPIDPLRERVREERQKRWDCSACGASANLGLFKTCWRCGARRFPPVQEVV